MLDDINVLNQRDTHKTLEVAATMYQQLTFVPTIQHETTPTAPKQVVFCGMGGSALASSIIADHLRQSSSIPLEVVKNYDLPAYVNEETLVIAASCSGTTEETLSCIQQARDKKAQLVLLATGGTIGEIATKHKLPYVELPVGFAQRMTVLYQLRALSFILGTYGVTGMETYESLAEASEWLKKESDSWAKDTKTEHNYAKLLAVEATGKTAVFYGGPLTGALAYKWKISWNENAKNTAFHSVYPEFNHNEFLGWSSHPVEKPFAIFDLVSPLEHPRVTLRMSLSDQLLSGKRPKATTITLKGDTYLQQAVWACTLADFTSIYLAILNGNNPFPVDIIMKLKAKLAEQ